MLDLEEIRVTRCSTSRSAITAYFCGVDVTMNQDVALGFNGKMNQHGTKSFRQYLQCRYEQGVADGGTHRRVVYRLGVGCKDSLAGYSHAFSIVAQLLLATIIHKSLFIIDMDEEGRQNKTIWPWWNFDTW